LIFVVLALTAASQVALDATNYLKLLESQGASSRAFDWVFASSTVFSLAISVIVAAFATYDAARNQRDWLHRLGVLLVVIDGLVGAGYWAMMRFQLF